MPYVLRGTTGATRYFPKACRHPDGAHHRVCLLAAGSSLVPQHFPHNVRHVGSQRSCALASQHFLLEAVVVCAIDRERQARRDTIPDRKALNQPYVWHAFVQEFDSLLHKDMMDSVAPSVNDIGVSINSSFLAAAAHTLPPEPRTARRPWISQATLDLICDGRNARRTADYVLEKELNKEIRRSAKRDRAQWLTDLAASCSWDSMRYLKKKRKPAQGRLRNEDGQLVSSEDRAETMANYLEKVQWAVDNSLDSTKCRKPQK